MQDLLPFNYSSWQSQYPRLTFESVIIDLPPEFVSFLQEGGIVVSSSSKALPQRGKPTELVVQGVDYDPEDTYSTETDSDDAQGRSSSDASSDRAEQEPWVEQFPQLHAQIESAIQELGGQAAPKLDWSSPTDALWISSYNSLKCCNADQVILLLKTSDRVMHDLEQLHRIAQQQQPTESSAALQPEDIQQQQQQQQQDDVQQAQASQAACLRPQVVLRRWHDLLPEREFRCFVCRHKLVAVSQRDVSQYFPQLSMSGELEGLKTRILAFHQQYIEDTFPVGSYALDVYVPPGSSPVRVLDFNPICETTSPLLFTWDELPYKHMQQPIGATGSDLDPPLGQQLHQAHNLQQYQQHESAQLQQQAASHGSGDVELRVVCDAGMIMPGARAATGMPLDMLGLQDSFQEVLSAMQQQQQQEQRSTE